MKIKMIIALGMMGFSQIAIAATTLGVASPSPSANTASDENVAQYQEWLKRNGQAPAPATVASPTASNQATTDANTHAAAAPEAAKAAPPAKNTPTDEPEPVVLQNELSEPGPVISKPLSYKESQELMLRQTPPSPPPSQDSIDAFNSMTQQNMPLTPQQVVKLRQLIDASQRAAVITPTVPPKPVSSTIMVNLAPGTTPPAIRLAQGYVTSLVFVDSAGSPWPIASYDLGDPKRTTIQWDQKSNILLIQAISPYGDSDLIVRLVGLPTPITLELVLGQPIVDYRTDIHVSGIGPNSKDLPTGVNLPASANELLLSVLDGIAPPGGKALTVKGGDCQAWLLGDKMYLRSRLTVLSPGWIGRMVSPDGMHAYEIQQTSSILVSQYGQPIELKVEGF